MPPLPGQEEPMRRIAKIVDWLITRPECAPFREPVDWQGLELWDYPQIIEKMMDLGTIKRRLERGYYSKTYQVAEDVKLVWKNCMTYNADGSDFWLLAKQYARRFEDRYRKIRQEYDVGDESGEEGSEEDEENDERGTKRSASGEVASKSSSKTGSSNKTPKASSGSSDSVKDDLSPVKLPPLDVRAQFGANLFLLSGMELGYVISTCEEECPSALENVRGGDESCCHIEINVDHIPSKVFDLLNTYVSGKVGHKNTVEASSTHSAEGGRPKKKQKK